MKDVDGVFTECYEAFRLPSYFGWNWAALSDCLRDLQWMPADRYLIVVENWSSVLSNLPEEREILLRVLAQAAEDWANPQGNPGNLAIPFNVLFCCSEDGASKVADEILRVQDGYA
ncbi:barstar family protein [Streptomyces sp. MTZ3.1]|uniref:Barstar family protein n=2 Tax=Streptomyces meridianus TaxID=2938945 RepID=A0ABT0XA94_9ACTN|nr:barstar family protein [Streptomyces meridianus]